MIADAQRAAGFVEGFIASAMHELRTPLAVVVGYAELLATRDDEQTRRAAAARIQPSANHLAALIDALLMAAALDAGSVVPAPRLVDLGESFAAAAGRLERHGEPRRVIVSRDDQAPSPFVWADRDHVAFVLDQLLWSACSSPAAGETLGSAVRCDHGSAVVTVDESAGTAVLPIVRELVRLQGGSSETGDTGFSFSLQLAPVEAAL